MCFYCSPIVLLLFFDQNYPLNHFKPMGLYMAVYGIYTYTYANTQLFKRLLLFFPITHLLVVNIYNLNRNTYTERRINNLLFPIVCFSGLKNDSHRETFVLRHELQGKKFPCKFIKIGNVIIIVIIMPALF